MSDLLHGNFRLAADGMGCSSWPKRFAIFTSEDTYGTYAQRLTTLATEHSTAFQPEVPVSNTSSSSPALLPLSICFSYFLLRYILTIRLPIGLYSCRHYLSHNPCRAGSPTGPISPWASGEGPLHLECTRRVRRDHHHHATLATRIVAFPAPAASALRQHHVRL